MESTDPLSVLLYLIKKDLPLTTSTAQIAQEVNVSQQTISRRLRDVEEAGFITRTVTPQGMILNITEKGKELLKQQYVHLQNYFDNSHKPTLKAVITTGLGEGKYYMSLPGYKSQFQEVCKYTPFPGTLNCQVDNPQLLLTKLSATRINGFTTDERTYGGLICYPITINNTTKAHLIIPDRTGHNKDTIEIIAPFNLREKLQLEDGDLITITP